MNETTELEVVEKQVMAENNRALSLKVMDADTYSEAGMILVACKDMEKQIKGFFKPLKDAAHKSWKQLCDKENEEVNKLKPGMEHLSKEMTDWNIEQEKIRAAEEARLRAEALKREEEERINAAADAEKEGNKEEAEAILNEPVHVATPVIPINVPKTNGLTMKSTWDFQIVNESLIPRQYLIVDEVKLRGIARAGRGSIKVPGVEFYEKKSIVGARR